MKHNENRNIQKGIKLCIINTFLINFTVFLDKIMNKSNQYIFLLMLCFSMIGCERSPGDVFSKAEEAFNTGNYRKALSGFTQIVTKHEDWDRKNEAQEYVSNYALKIYSRAETLRNEKEYYASVDALDYIVKYYTDLDIAPKSQYLIGDVFSNDLKDHSEAIIHYKNVVIKFSGSREEPHAQFMIGYIYANIKDKKVYDPVNALKEYNLFLEKYPDHELAPSVQFEIQWLGKDINDIPALKHISS